jgi:hypothetical protein
MIQVNALFRSAPEHPPNPCDMCSQLKRQKVRLHLTESAELRYSLSDRWFAFLQRRGPNPFRKATLQHSTQLHIYGVSAISWILVNRVRLNVSLLSLTPYRVRVII